MDSLIGNNPLSDIFLYLAAALGTPLIANTLQRLYYLRVHPLLRPTRPPPPPNTPTYIYHYRLIHSLLLVAIFLYSILNVYLTLPPNHYTTLSISPHFSEEKQLKVQWRKLSLMYHPDKIGNTAENEAFFMGLTKAHEVISHPAKRAVYDRFGEPYDHEWRDVSTFSEFLLRNAMGRFVGYYGLGVLGIVFMSMIGMVETGRAWRLLSLAGLAVFEAYVITRPYSVALANPLPGFLTKLIANFLHPRGQLLPYEIVMLVKRVVMGGTLVAAQLSRVWAHSEKDEETALEYNLTKVEMLAGMLEGQAGQAMATEFMPFQGDGKAVNVLEGRLVEHLLESQVRNDVGVREAIGEAMRRRGGA